MALLTDKVESRKCLCESSKSIDDDSLLHMLPIEYKYALCELKKSNDNYFECKFRVNICSKVDAIRWFEELKFSSNTAYTKAKTYQENTQGNVFKNVWKCIHNTRPAQSVRVPHSKHTNCPARLIITVKQPLLSKSYRSKDVHLKDFPMVVTLRHIHNHSTVYQEDLKYDTPDDDIQKIFLSYFKKGYAPAKAMDIFVTEMEKELLGSDDSTLPEFSICPDERWVYHFYYRVFRPDYDKRKDFECKDLNLSSFTKDDLVNPYITEILENMSETSEILLVDAEGNIERISLLSPNEKHNFSDKEPETSSVMEQLHSIFENILEKVNTSDDVFQAAKKFISNNQKIDSDKSLVSALENFGKTNINNFHLNNAFKKHSHARRMSRVSREILSRHPAYQ